MTNCKFSNTVCDALRDLLGEKLFSYIEIFVENSSLNEIRLRLDKPIALLASGVQFFLSDEDGGRIFAESADIERVLAVASGNSVYAINENLIEGFLPYKSGIRIGLAGEGVIERGNMITLKNISSLCVRVPSQLIGKLPFAATLAQNVESTLIISPTGCGKTTFLRELTRLTSDKGINCVVIDERLELSASCEGVAGTDLGISSDVLCKVPKIKAYESVIRSMNPQVVVTDEVFGKAEIDSIIDLVRCGVKVFASVHAESISALKENKFYQEFVNCFDRIVCLGKPIGSVIDYCEK